MGLVVRWFMAPATPYAIAILNDIQHGGGEACGASKHWTGLRGVARYDPKVYQSETVSVPHRRNAVTGLTEIAHDVWRWTAISKFGEGESKVPVQ